MRVVADHLAAMTDGQAMRTYKRLFDPDFRSITEIT
jgi:dGTP triphosphohydrolase